MIRYPIDVNFDDLRMVSNLPVENAIGRFGRISGLTFKKMLSHNKLEKIRTTAAFVIQNPAGDDSDQGSPLTSYSFMIKKINLT
ncbi:MAG: hypothetical protein ABJQ69_03525 [Ekhidna sp.]